MRLFSLLEKAIFSQAGMPVRNTNDSWAHTKFGGAVGL